MVPRLEPVVLPKSKYAPAPVTEPDPALFKYTDFGRFGDVVEFVETCETLDPVLLTVAPGEMLVQVGAVPVVTDSELLLLVSKFKSKFVEAIAEKVAEIDLSLVMLEKVYPSIMALRSELKLGDDGVDIEAPSMMIELTSYPALGTNVKVAFAPLST